MVQRTHKLDSSTSIFHGWIFLLNFCEFLKKAKCPGSNEYDDQAKDDGESYVQILTHTTCNTINGGGALKNISNYFTVIYKWFIKEYGVHGNYRKKVFLVKL